MTELSFSILAIIMFAVIVLGALVGGLTGNSLFIYIMVGFPMIAFFLVGVVHPEQSPTQPSLFNDGAVLPVIALVAACVASIIGIALGHASRHLIKTRGGSGEKIAFAALIVGYSALTIQLAVVLWILTYSIQAFAG